MKLEKINLLNDIYYSKEYISLYLKENEQLFEFIYEEKDYVFYNISIKRPISKIGKIEINDGFYDLETAYGYGGYFVNTDDKSFLYNAFESYKERCKDEKIIAEFIRFHPFNSFPKKHEEFFDMNIYDRDTILVNINRKYEEIKQSYSSNLKRNISNAKKNNLIFNKVCVDSNFIYQFYNLYSQTMKKNNANEFYFFDVNYFETLFKIKNVELYVVYHNTKIINMIVVFKSNNIIYYHLGATDSEYYNLNSNSFIFDSIILDNIKESIYLYLGGGTTSNKDDSLFKFKQKFSRSTKPFYISGKIYDKRIYNEYVRVWEKQSNKQINYFLKYRLEIE